MKNVLCFISVLLFLSITGSVEAKKKSFGKNLYWELSTDGVLTISGSGDMPYTYTKKNKVKSATAPWDKQRDNIYKVIIENGVTSIGIYMFYRHLNLKSIEIPNSVSEIGRASFAGCKSLTQINLPSAIKTINPFTFADCSSLISISIPEGVVTIDWAAFRNCSSLKSITFPTTLRTIEVFAFEDCTSLTTISFPTTYGAAIIKEYAFDNCGLSSVSLPPSVNHVGKCSFRGCPIKQLSIHKSLKGIDYGAFMTSGDVSGNEDFILDKYLYTGTILSMPDYVLENPEHYGISRKSADAYRYGVHDENGKIICAGKSNWVVEPYNDSNSKRSGYFIKENDKGGILAPDGHWYIPLSNGYSIEPITINKYAYFLVKDNNAEKCWITLITGKKYFDWDAYEIKILDNEFVLRKNEKNGYYSVVTSNGQNIIPYSRKYTRISYIKDEKVFLFDKTGGYTGTCNIQGKEVNLTPLTSKPTEIESRSTSSSSNKVKEIPTAEEIGLQLLGGILISSATNSDKNSKSDSYTDASVFDLKGKVKSCRIESTSSSSSYLKQIMSNDIITFGSSGKLIPKDGVEVKRDETNRISEYGDFTINYIAFTNRIGSLRCVTVFYGIIVETYELIYGENESDRVSSQELHMDEDTPKTTTYKYTKFDTKGNWIERIATCGSSKYTERRTITYY